MFINDLHLSIRPTTPISANWTADFSATIIQSAWRGYACRKRPAVSELRKWQREWRTFNRKHLIFDDVSF